MVLADLSAYYRYPVMPIAPMRSHGDQGYDRRRSSHNPKQATGSGTNERIAGTMSR